MHLKCFFAIVATFAFTPMSAAQEWTSASDRDLRRDVELIKAYDIIDGPLNSWPVSWKQITKGISTNRGAAYPAHVMRAMERIQRKIPTKNWYFSSDLRLTNDSSLVRGFGATARSDTDLTLSSAYSFLTFTDSIINKRTINV